MAKEVKTEIEVLDEINSKLDRLIAVTAIANCSESKKVDILLGLDIDYNTISSLTGMTPNAIAVRKNRSKGNQKKKSDSKSNGKRHDK